ncbi:hypothetical protein ECE50_023885 [Chitinophaga sp. Mgbs1]|uniref:Uncharacterized protein n=1 Tax=Chitinophaga solisilvae TaxID=1233460 RepID=A0A3S1AY35_9BACT|nr:hypothetical protein [Chitinophaga solisilvae]
MRYLRILSLAAVFMAAVNGLQAQTLQEILDRYTQAMGGADKLSAIRTQYSEGVMIAREMEVPIRRWVKQGQALRVEFDALNTKNIQVVTPTGGWQYLPVAHKTEVEELDPAVRTFIKSQLDVTGELFNVEAKGKKVEFIGKDTANGAPAYKLKVYTADSLSALVYLDAKTCFIVKAVNFIEYMGARTELVTILSDYRHTPEGYAYAATTEQTPIGSGMKIHLTRVEINKPIADELFERPKGK